MTNITSEQSTSEVLMKTYAEHHGNGAKKIYLSFIFVWNWNQNEDNSKFFLINVWNWNQKQDN
jgi:hypothetical protein